MAFIIREVINWNVMQLIREEIYYMEEIIWYRTEKIDDNWYFYEDKVKY